MIFAVIITGIVAYFLGNISTALIVSRVVFHDDIRNHGSGSAGATNAFRTYGWKWGLLTLVLDAAKAALAYGFGYFMGQVISNGLYSPHLAALAGVMVVIGHDWPIMFGFRGGKGIAATFGIILAVNPLMALISGALAILSMLITNYMSIGSIVGIASAFVLSFFFGEATPTKIMFFVLILLDVFQHRANIQRLLDGSENKMMSKSLIEKIKGKFGR